MWASSTITRGIAGPRPRPVAPVPELAAHAKQRQLAVRRPVNRLQPHAVSNPSHASASSEEELARASVAAGGLERQIPRLRTLIDALTATQTYAEKVGAFFNLRHRLLLSPSSKVSAS